MNGQRPQLRSTVPGWLANLLGFGILILIVLGAFFFQIRDINRSMRKNVLSRTSMVAAVIEENLTTGALALDTIDRIMTAFLRDKASFIAYLDEIDPLHPDELTALARETGLLGIRLSRNGRNEDAPAGWIGQEQGIGCGREPDSLFIRQKKIFLAHRTPSQSRDLDCVVIGIDGSSVARLRERTSLGTMLSTLSRLPGIVRIDFFPGPREARPAKVRFIEENGRPMVESTLETERGVLVVRLDARPFDRRQKVIRSQFFLFGGLLLVLGIFFSWLLHRMQTRVIRQALAYEQALAREREDAALGRTTATIAHEIRNPLNAISMGLQRLRMEEDTPDRERRKLVRAMEEAVNRAARTVHDLQRFARPLRPVFRDIDLNGELDRILALYRQRIEELGIDLEIDRPSGPVRLSSDPDLVNEILENLIRNCLEAQPGGGRIRIHLTRTGEHIDLSVTNTGLDLPPDQAARIGEPYFTTKTRGTGLGLALSRRIAAALGGGLIIVPDLAARTLTVTLSLPAAPPQQPNHTSQTSPSNHHEYTHC